MLLTLSFLLLKILSTSLLLILTFLLLNCFPYAAQPPNHPYVAVAHPYVSVAQLPLYATQPQKLPCVIAPQAQQQNVVGLTYPFGLATQSQLPVSQLSLSCQQCQPQS